LSLFHKTFFCLTIRYSATSQKTQCEKVHACVQKLVDLVDLVQNRTWGVCACAYILCAHAHTLFHPDLLDSLDFLSFVLLAIFFGRFLSTNALFPNFECLLFFVLLLQACMGALLWTKGLSKSFSVKGMLLPESTLTGCARYRGLT
jgi:hypothetical protein